MTTLSKSLEQIRDGYPLGGQFDMTRAIKSEILESRTVLLNSSTLATVDRNLSVDFVNTVWEHATKRQEDQTILLVDEVNTLEKFVNALTGGHAAELIASARLLRPFNVSLSLALSDNGEIIAAEFKGQGIDSATEVWNNKVFSLFHNTATEKESVFLSLKHALEQYPAVEGRASKNESEQWRAALKSCGMSKKLVRNLLTGIAGIMLIGNESDDDFEEACSMLGLQPTVHRTDQLVVNLFNRLILRFIENANASIARAFNRTFAGAADQCAALTTLIQLGWNDESKAKVLGCIFDDNFSINREMINEGLNVPRAPSDSNCHLPPSPPPLEPFAIPELEEDSVLAGAPLPEGIDFKSSVECSRVWSILDLSDRDLEPAYTSWLFEPMVSRSAVIDFTADFEHDEFFSRYGQELYGVSMSTLMHWAMRQGFSSAEFAVGGERVWVSETCWRYLETKRETLGSPLPIAKHRFSNSRHVSSEYGGENAIPLVPPTQDTYTNGLYGEPEKQHQDDFAESIWYGDYEKNPLTANVDAERGLTPLKKQSPRRKLWMTIVRFMTWMIPESLLRLSGLSDVQAIAWKEKVAICLIIFSINCSCIFYMIFLAKLLCPQYDKVWNAQEVATHQGADDYYVSIHGSVYDMTRFYREQHSDTFITTDAATMMPFAGQDLSSYFPKPLTVACPNLVNDTSVWLQSNSSAMENPTAIHYSGHYKVAEQESKTYSYSWFDDVLTPALEKFYKGDLVIKKKDVIKGGESGQMWAMIDGGFYDLSDYFYSLSILPGVDVYDFLDPDVKNLFVNYAGEDITELLNNLDIKKSVLQDNVNCIKEVFYAGKLDFRDDFQCQFSNYLLLAVAAILGFVILAKFLSALQYLGQGSKPPRQEKFVICHVPVYTEGEEEIRRAVDSLTVLDYPNDRKLLFIVCDGMVKGQGNDHSTPNILMSILGRDHVSDVDAKSYKAVGTGMKQLNYAQVYSGLYEHDGNVVPYLVIVKTGNPNESVKPGNRGKRDSQLLVMNFFNRVHFQSMMSPLELEMFHHLNNVIGIDPEAYEYLFMVDADTSVEPRSLNQLVSACIYDPKIAGICGETKLANEHESFWTMIQVYEYFISHHLTKAFESMFGSVTCLPGCFSMYRLRDGKGQPMIISNQVIRDYYEVGVDTLHQQNLLSLGEDRFLTTLMTKHFNKARFTFVPSALAYTTAPSDIKVLISQRRRWINSTVHNLVELLRLNNMCGFCFFGMRFFVFVDLAGTVLLPSVCIYLGYLIYILATRHGAFPIISICTLAAVYGLQALVFLIKLQFQHIGWMLFYLLTYPVHSFVLPVYSFWKQDDFSWGSTRVVDGQLVKVVEDEGEFDASMVPRQLWTAYALVNQLPGAHRDQRNVPQGNYYTDHSAKLREMTEKYKSMDMTDTETLFTASRPASKFFDQSRPQSTVNLTEFTNTPMASRSQATLSMPEISDQKICNATLNLILRVDNFEGMSMNSVVEQVERVLNTKLDAHQRGVVAGQVDRYLEEMGN